MAYQNPNWDSYMGSPRAEETTEAEARQSRRRSVGQLVRTTSQKLLDANLPGGFSSATGHIVSDISTAHRRRGSSYSSSRQSRSASLSLFGRTPSGDIVTGVSQDSTGAVKSDRSDSAPRLDLIPAGSSLGILEQPLTEDPAEIAGGKPIDRHGAAAAENTTDGETLTTTTAYSGGNGDKTTLSGQDESMPVPKENAVGNSGLLSNEHKSEATGQRESRTRPSVRMLDSTDDEDEQPLDPEDQEFEDWTKQFDPRPAVAQKRASKNLSLMLGEDSDDDADASTAVPTRSLSGNKKAAAGHKEKDIELDGLGEPDAPDSEKKTNRLSRRLSRPLSYLKSAVAPTSGTIETGTDTAAARDVKEAPAPTQEPTGTSEDQVYPTGYVFPPKKSFMQQTGIGLKWFLTEIVPTPWGAFWTLYGLLVVAWGGMLFLLLCNAAPAMCVLGNGTYDCNDINSPRREWVEYTSQILNALFCVTGFGLAPWRIRDFYFTLRWRLGGDYAALRRLAGWHASWFRLPDSQQLPAPREPPADCVDPMVDTTDPRYPTSAKYAPKLPLTGIRAAPTDLWRMDFVVWAFMWNTWLQVVLSAFMWHYDRYTRPSWSTGLFVALACIVAGAGGIMQFVESNRIKKIEGVAWTEADRKIDAALHSSEV